MTKMTLTPAPNEGHVGGNSPRMGLDPSQYFAQIGGSVDSVREEIDDCYADLKTFLNREPDEMMRICRGHSARLSELRVRIQRIEDMFPQWRNVRMREIEPTLDELKDQWANASRLQAVRELDWKMEMGQA